VDRETRSRVFGWWYAAIGTGFLLLAVQRWLVGGLVSLILLRLLIAAGFFFLAWAERKGRVRR
jgi:hypothetical protein